MNIFFALRFVIASSRISFPTWVLKSPINNIMSHVRPIVSYPDDCRNLRFSQYLHSQ
jgi:hypothetical protein